MAQQTGFQEFEGKELNIEHFDGCPSFVEMTGIGFNRPLYGSALFPSYKASLCFFRDREGDYITSVADQERVGSAVIAQFMKDPRSLSDLYGTWMVNFEAFRVFQLQHFERDLSKLSDDELIQWSDELREFVGEKVSMPGFIDGFMFYAEKRLGVILKEYCDAHGISEYSTIYSTLTAPTEASFINEEEDALFPLVQEIIAAGYSESIPLKEFLVSHPAQGAKLAQHLKAYSWIKCSYVGYTPYTIDDVEAEVKRGVGTQDTGKTFDVHRIQKKDLMDHYSFTPEIRAISALSEILVKWQDQRKHYTLMFVSLRHKVLQEIARRVPLDLELLRYAESTEFRRIIDGSLKASELEIRKSGVLFLYSDEKSVVLMVGNEAQEYFKKLSLVQIDAVTELKGTVASLGKAQGPARVISSIAQIGTVQDGDILVAAMTRPEHLAGMRRAAAIVTDDGGITCHAAIVSRELKKPCIIGTKYATKVFHDGDLLEVDATSGIVTILKKADSARETPVHTNT